MNNPDEVCISCDGRLKTIKPFGDSPEIKHCIECRTESIFPLPSFSELKEHYSNYPATKTEEDQILKLIDLSMHAWKFYLNKMSFTDRINSKRQVLEIGFGNGAGLFAGAKLGLRSAGIDLDPVGVQNAKEFAQKYSFDAAIYHADVSELRKDGMKFDIVKASQILEHVIDPLDFLDEIYQSQKPGGYLIIESPNNDAAFWKIKNLVRKRFHRSNYYNSLKLNEHLWGFTPKGLNLLLNRAGYKTIFMTDYASGNPIFEPQSTLWYPKFGKALLQTVKRRSSLPLIYSSIRLFDQFASRFFGMGTGLAVLCKKKD